MRVDWQYVGILLGIADYKQRLTPMASALLEGPAAPEGPGGTGIEDTASTELAMSVKRRAGRILENC